MVNQDQPSARVVEQRVRNRVIEHLELVASYPEQDDYARIVPHVHIPYELINQWEDWVPTGPLADPSVLGVYSPAEIGALGQVYDAWQVAAQALPDDFPSFVSAQSLPEWERWRDAAASALGVLLRRGRMSEDVEEP